MNQISTIIILLSMLMLQACTASYTAHELSLAKQTLGVEDRHEVSRKNAWRLSTDTPIYIAYALNDQPEYRNLPENRRAKHQLRNALEDAFVKRYSEVSSSPEPLPMPAAVELARLQGSRVLVFPQLLQYPVRKEGRPKLFTATQARFRVLLVDTLSGQVLDMATLTSDTGFSLTDDRETSELFIDAADQYVALLAGS